MRSRQPHERGRRVWRAAGVALLGLMGGSSGCQWSSDRQIVRPPATNPSVATIEFEEAERPDARPAGNNSTAAITPNPASPEVVQTSAISNTPPNVILASTNTRTHDEAIKEQPGEAAGTPAKKPTTAPSAAVAQKGNEKEQRPATGVGESSYQVDRTLPSPTNGIATPAIPAPEQSLPITLNASLALAGVENPVIAIADQAIRVARAQQLQAQVLLLPSLNVGASYDVHNGPLQGSPGEIRKVDRQAVYYGLGAYSVVAGSVNIPGLWIVQPLADAIYEPLVARQVVANRRFAAAATRNQVLLEVASAYLDLMGAEGRLAVIRQSEKDFQEVASLTAKYADPRVRLGREADANRALSDLLQLQFEEKRIQEDVAVASAELARLLNLDPSTRLHTGEVPIQVVQFIDPKESLPSLLEIAARNRPELMAAAANIRASQTRLRQEQTRPLWPTLWAGFSAGDFGGGAVAIQNPNVPASQLSDGVGQPGGHTTPKFGNIAGRADVDVMAYWTLQNFGMGNIAHVKDRRAELNEARAARIGVLNQVYKEVADAYNTAAQAFKSIEVERRRVEESTDGFQRDLKRILTTERGLPIEVLNNAERLASARQRLLAAVIGYDRAQFQLFVALGRPPTLVVEGDTLGSPAPLPADGSPASEKK
jgi:outer membrane protein TolC